MDALSALEPPDTELVLGIVAAIGSDLENFQQILLDYVKKFSYTTQVVRLTDIFKHLKLDQAGISTDHPDPCKQIKLRMDAGNYLRQTSGRNDILALHGVAKIHEYRQSRRAANKEHGCEAEALSALEQAALTRTVYVLRSLKHHEEVRTLRRIYGSGFFLIALYSTEAEREKFLTDRKNCESDFVRELMRRDQQEDEPHGQKTRDTFALADVFIRFDPHDPLTAERGLDRFLRLVFGDPHVTPTRDEHAMYMAFASSLRSADLSRQVGAVVLNEAREIVGTGANDVPSFGGGSYWPEEKERPDFRDHRAGADLSNLKGGDANEIRRSQIVLRIMQQLAPSIGMTGASDRELLERGDTLLRNTGIRDLIEFSRAVHAEMNALMACVRTGVSARGGTLYCTTFPCHICAKHIVDAGITRVVYVEPYPKSLAKDLHGDAIAVEQSAPVPKDKVHFEPFIGVGPRHFPTLFAMNLGNGYPIKRKANGGLAREWDQTTANLRVPNIPISFVDREDLVISALSGLAKPNNGEARVGSSEEK